jgi:hypothetical protein
MIRTIVLGLALAALAACGDGSGDDGNVPTQPGTSVNFTVSSPEIDVQSGQEISYCYSFRLPVSAEVFMKQWSATFTPGVERIVLFFQHADARPDGTLSAIDCPFGSGSSTNGAVLSSWAFTASSSGDQFVFPENDGTGRPVGMRASAGQPAVLWLHLMNPTNGVLKAKVDITGQTYAIGTAVTRAESFTAFMGSTFSIPPKMVKEHLQTCATPAGARFFSMTMHTNRLAQALAIKTADPNGGSAINLFDKVFLPTDNKLNPGVKRFNAPAFATFANDQIIYACTHDNDSTRTVRVGSSVTNDERCMAVTHFFPATEPRGCFENLPIP